MKIYSDLKKEKEAMPALASNAVSKGENFSAVDIFDKANFIEKLWEKLSVGEKVTIKLDEDSKDYPNILDDKPPRFVILDLDTGKRVPLQEHLESFNIKIDYNKNNYILTLEKNKNEKLNLGLKIDRSKTINLSLLGEDKAFFGVKSYYYRRRKE